MRTITVREDKLKELLDVLPHLSWSRNDGIVDTWAKPKVENCTTCTNALKYERFNKGAKTVIFGGCKFPQHFIVTDTNPVKCDQYKY